MRSDVRTRYGKRASEKYDRKRMVKPWWDEQPAIIESLLIGRTVLDAPVGTGRFMDCYKGRDVTGMDISTHMLQKARDRGWESLFQGDIQSMAFPDNHFDCIVSIHYLMHLEPDDFIQAASEMKRVASKAIICDIKVGNKMSGHGCMKYPQSFINDAFD